MTANPLLGVCLHAIGALAAASFYLPYKRVRGWSWESYWLVGGVWSWLVGPIVLASILCPDLAGTLRAAPVSSVLWTYAFGVLWGIGGLTFGLSMRYLGISLGYAMALGFCAAFGTIVPPLFGGELPGMLAQRAGQVTLLGVLVCLGGIAVCGLAGMRKEGELSEAQRRAVIAEFSLMKGLWVATFAGVMSACMAFAFAAGKPIQAEAVAHGAPDIFSNLPVLVVVLLGGLTTNAVWCAYLNIAKKTYGDYLAFSAPGYFANHAFCAMAGLTWYFQFFFYSMGTRRMGAYDFSSWTIHMAFIIAFSNVWGLLLHEWRGTSRPTRQIVHAGIAVLVMSTVIVGFGNYIASLSQ